MIWGLCFGVCFGVLGWAFRRFVGFSALVLVLLFWWLRLWFSDYLAFVAFLLCFCGCCPWVGGYGIF